MTKHPRNTKLVSAKQTTAEQFQNMTYFLVEMSRLNAQLIILIEGITRDSVNLLQGENITGNSLRCNSDVVSITTHVR